MTLQKAPVEVVRGGATDPDVGVMPALLHEFLNGLGWRGVFARATGDNLDRYRSLGWRVLLVSDLPDVLGVEKRPTLDYLREVGEDPEAHRGQIRKGDCTLLYRSIAAETAEEQERKRRLSAMYGHGSDDALDRIAEVAARGRGKGVKVTPTEIRGGPDASVHMSGGPKVLDPEFQKDHLERLREMEELAGA